jgi:rsbT co-antagonist protein RsbR
MNYFTDWGKPMTSLTIVSQYLTQNANKIAKEIVDFNINKLDFKVPEEIVEKAYTYQKEFIGYLWKAITLESEEEVALGFIEWNKIHGQQEETYLLDKVSSIVKPYPEIRLLFIKKLTAISKKHNLSIDETVLVNTRLNHMLDISLTESILLYEQHVDMQRKQSQKQIMELSSPIVPIHNGIAILPLVGSIDIDRAEHIMNRVIPKINQLNVTCLIIDFSGLVTVDAEIASYISKIYNVLRLLGTRAIITGLRPSMAKNIVREGISFTPNETYSTVKQALESLAVDN